MECEGLSNLGRACERPYDKTDCDLEDEELEVEFQYCIPLEIISYIFRFLDAKSLCACRFVNYELIHAKKQRFYSCFFQVWFAWTGIT